MPDAKVFVKAIAKTKEIRKQAKVVENEINAKKSLQETEKKKKVDKRSDMEKAYMEAKKTIMESVELKEQQKGIDGLVKQETEVNQLKQAA